MNKETKAENLHVSPADGKLPVSGWRWFDAVIKFKNGNVCNYASTTNGTIEDAKKQAANVLIGQTAEILSIAFR